MKHPIPKKLIEYEISLIVVGCGGNGSQMLSGLARLHLALRSFGHQGLRVTAYDSDTVSPANVGRQLFSPADIGKNKATVLINRLNLYYGLNWKAQPVRFNSYSGSHADIIIGCVDSIKGRKEITRNSQATYWLDLGNTDKKGQVILGELHEPEGKVRKLTQAERDKLEDGDEEDGVVEEPAKRKRLPHFFDLFPELKKKNVKEDDAPSCSLAEALERQDLFINQTVTTFALQLLWQFYRRGGLDIHGYFINLETGRVTPLPIK